jgi:hypothetical protein
MLLPPPPLRLRSSYVLKYGLGGMLLLLLGAAAAAGYGWWQLGEVQNLLDESRIWESGVPALKTSVTGHSRSTRFIFHDHTLNVQYVDAGGVQRFHTLKFDTFGADIDRSHPPVARHLKDDPDRFALSWAVGAAFSRWAAIIVLGVVGVGLIGGAFTILGLRALRQLADARRCASFSDELIVRIESVVPKTIKGRHTHNLFHFTGQTADGRVVTGKVELPKKHEPLFADPDHRTMVALVDPDKLERPVVVRADFYPFELASEEQDSIRAAIAARGQSPAPPRPGGR